MQREDRRIILTLDNASSHFINYEPKNIELAYFSANMTSHVQPLDAGIVRCFKAHYRQAFSLRAVEMDEADELDIYKIDLLEAMTMACEAWDAVSSETIKNCWNHTRIQG